MDHGQFPLDSEFLDVGNRTCKRNGLVEFIFRLSDRIRKRNGNQLNRNSSLQPFPAFRNGLQRCFLRSEQLRIFIFRNRIDDMGESRQLIFYLE